RTASASRSTTRSSSIPPADARAAHFAADLAHTVAMATRDQWNAARYQPGTATGHYESWFQRANDPTGARAFWIRYTIFAPRGRPGDAVGELWAIAFDRAAARITAVKQVHPIAACAFARDRLDVAIGDARLDDGALRGAA